MAYVYKKRKVGDKLEVQIGKKPDNEGVLSVLIDLPLDIFFEITSRLHPVDILQLSRVSKEFRSLFMSRNSRHVWVAARRNAPGVPDCPPDMTEGQYARLLFEHDCYACGKPIAKMLDYALRLRYCGDCFKTNVKKGSSALNGKLWRNCPDLWTMLPRSDHKHRYAYHINGRTDDFQSKDNTDQHSYYVAELAMVAKRYAELKPDPAAFEKFAKQQQETAYQMMQHALQLEEWEAMSRRDVRENERDCAESRKARIRENLLKLGWEEKYFPIHDYEWLSITEKPKELTDSVWAYVRPRLEAMIREHKKNILEAELRDRLGKRRQEAQPFYEELVRQIPVVHDGDSKLRPPIELACQLSPTLNRSLNEAGATIQVTKDRWDFIRETLVRDLEAYSLTLKRSMISLVPQMEIDALHSTSPDEFDILYQASFLVRCPMCAKLYGYPSVFDHPRCSRHAELHALQSYATMDPREQEIPEIVAYVLSALDLPKDTPYKTLESLGKRLRCLCGNPKVCAPMDFGTLVAHILEENRTHKKVVGRRGASPDAQAVTLCNDHDVVEGNLPLALLPVYILPHIEGAHHIPSNTPMYCRLCKVAAHRLVTLRSQPEIDYHMSAKHLRTVSSRDDVLTYQEFWPSRIY